MQVGVPLMFCNTYHLLVHPGADVIEKARASPNCTWPAWHPSARIHARAASPACSTPATRQAKHPSTHAAQHCTAGRTVCVTSTPGAVQHASTALITGCDPGRRREACTSSCDALRRSSPTPAAFRLALYIALSIHAVTAIRNQPVACVTAHGSGGGGALAAAGTKG